MHICCRMSTVDKYHRGVYIRRMLKTDAIKFYGSQARLARALGINRSAVLRWTKRVPMARAFRLQQITGGKLKCDVNSYLRAQ
jgi:transcriptional repressor of cell division inhibition gene dicB